MSTGSRPAKGADFYASKAGARTAALENLNGALADLAKHEQRASAAATRLETVESEARAELERTVAAAERALEEARSRAQAICTERLQAARSERGTAEGLVAKARAAVQKARGRLLKLVPPADARSVTGPPEHLKEDASESDVLASIESDPREHIVMDPSCDRRTEDGMCAGHDQAEARP